MFTSPLPRARERDTDRRCAYVCLRARVSSELDPGCQPRSCRCWYRQPLRRPSRPATCALRPLLSSRSYYHFSPRRYVQHNAITASLLRAGHSFASMHSSGLTPVCSSFSQDLAAKPTAACLAPLTNVFLGALTSAKDDARRAKQALTLGHSIVAFAGKLPGAALKPKAVTALWGPDGTVRTDLSSAGKSYIEEPSVGAQSTRMLTSIKQVRVGPPSTLIVALSLWFRHLTYHHHTT